MAISQMDSPPPTPGNPLNVPRLFPTTRSPRILEKVQEGIVTAAAGTEI